MALRSAIVQHVPGSVLRRIDRHKGLKHALRRLGEHGVPSGVREVTLPSGPCKGARMTLDFSRNERHLWLGTYEPWVAWALPRLLRRDSVVWDVGAYIGYYLIFARRFSDREHLAIEADPNNLERLSHHLADNGVRARVRNVAVGDRNGSVRMRSARDGSLSRLADGGGVEVEMLTLDALSGSEPAPPDLVIMDIEGAEVEALAGASRLIGEVRPTFLIELHGERGVAASRTLEAHGYRLYTAGDPLPVDQQLASTNRLHACATPSSVGNPFRGSTSAQWSR